MLNSSPYSIGSPFVDPAMLASRSKTYNEGKSASVTIVPQFSTGAEDLEREAVINFAMLLLEAQRFIEANSRLILFPDVQINGIELLFGVRELDDMLHQFL